MKEGREAPFSGIFIIKNVGLYTDYNHHSISGSSSTWFWTLGPAWILPSSILVSFWLCHRAYWDFKTKHAVLWTYIMLWILISCFFNYFRSTGCVCEWVLGGGISFPVQTCFFLCNRSYRLRLNIFINRVIDLALVSAILVLFLSTRMQDVGIGRERWFPSLPLTDILTLAIEPTP